MLVDFVVVEDGVDDLTGHPSTNFVF